MRLLHQLDSSIVRCRTGSLEIGAASNMFDEQVRCRTGSLEKILLAKLEPTEVRCRTGSLENHR